MTYIVEIERLERFKIGVPDCDEVLNAMNIARRLMNDGECEPETRDVRVVSVRPEEQ